ncbi:predicted protein [Lichtheimia corymbifera JMRC:FSU:9682]|uniref:Uncharacterized protein n=1 Tax=Lichtheimia corymbifera JMRC:FSU:9682 TaxID=1263082 RepID=A0A068S8B2_9FUNG|nr:predicted protein [Lichtheimia corymbifera JMRC:FSU:9682]
MQRVHICRNGKRHTARQVSQTKYNHKGVSMVNGNVLDAKATTVTRAIRTRLELHGNTAIYNSYQDPQCETHQDGSPFQQLSTDLPTYINARSSSPSSAPQPPWILLLARNFYHIRKSRQHVAVSFLEFKDPSTHRNDQREGRHISIPNLSTWGTFNMCQTS